MKSAPNKLTPEQRQEILARWIKGNEVLAAGGIAETSGDLALAYGVARSTITYTIRVLGQGKHPRGRRRMKTCACGKRADAGHGRCQRCSARHRWATDEGYREARTRNTAKFRAKQKRRAADRLRCPALFGTIDSRGEPRCLTPPAASPPKPSWTEWPP
jgi:hypothetical protein